jgi:prepilin-type N-terminal cleavage/methylation domain-containing protein
MARAAMYLQNRHAGFTLIEITLAVLILASGLSVILGVQSSIIGRTLEDQRVLRAMLAARTVLSALEIRHKPLEVGTSEGSVKEILEKFSTPDNDDSENSEVPDDLHLALTVEFQPLALPDPSGKTPGSQNDKALKRLTLTVGEATSTEEILRITSFIPNDEDEEVIEIEE